MNAGSVLERLRRDPAGAELLRLGDAGHLIHVVGGYVRDIALEREPREIDVVVEGDAAAVAAELSAALGGAAVSHGRFGTATVDGPAGRIDIASARSERYAHAGALPEVTTPASMEDDLRRRDFTVNAVAVQVAGGEAGVLRSAPRALDDLRGRSLRVLHERSFIDDPTRLLRLSRYAERLGLTVEPRTAQLAERAITSGTLSTISRARQGAELRLAFEEPDALKSVAGLQDRRLLDQLHPELRFDPVVARRALELLPSDARAAPVLLACCILSVPAGPELAAWLSAAEFSARDRDLALTAAAETDVLSRKLGAAQRPSEIWAVARGHSAEAVAVAGARAPEGSAGELASQQWLRSLRHVKLQITGHDLIAAGITAGPEVGRRLAAALAAKLDGQVVGDRGAELAAAMASAPPRPG